MAFIEDILLQPIKPGTVATATLDQRELAVIIFEALSGCRRPAGMSAEVAASDIRGEDPETWAGCSRAAGRVLDYLADRLRNSRFEPVQ